MLLSRDPGARKRRLGIRTYRVIPLSPRTGVVEWVEDTIPIGEYLVKNPANYKHVRLVVGCGWGGNTFSGGMRGRLLGRSRISCSHACHTLPKITHTIFIAQSAHARYRPKDLNSFVVRKKLAEAEKNNRLATYNALVARFKPVFHYFLLERFPDPSVWFHKRLRFAADR